MLEFFREKAKSLIIKPISIDKVQIGGLIGSLVLFFHAHFVESFCEAHLLLQCVEIWSYRSYAVQKEAL